MEQNELERKKENTIIAIVGTTQNVYKFYALMMRLELLLISFPLDFFVFALDNVISKSSKELMMIKTKAERILQSN
jgi:hypothetical protein